MDVGSILLYCFYACLQMYILMFIGMLGVWKKILNEKKSKVFSSVVFALIIPFFQIVQISSAGTYEILKLIWVIIVNFIVAMGLSYLITKLFHVIFQMEVRVKESFAAMCSFPAVGALPLVIGYSYCFPGGPIEDDPFCKEFYGVMFLSVMVLNFGLFFFGYVMLLLDRKRNETYAIKMKYIWHEIISSLYEGKNYTILAWFKDYTKDPLKAEEEYNNFAKVHKLPDNFNAENFENDNYDAMDYYIKALEFVEKNLNEEKKTNFEELKNHTINGLQKKPPEYPICPTIHINNSKANLIDKKFSEWETKMKQANPDFEVKFDVVKVDIMVLLKSLISPPNTAFFLGLTLALSKVREIIFGDNIYFQNIVDGFKLITGNLTPFLFLVIGVACLPKPKEEIKEIRHSLLSKLHVALLFIVRFLIIPAIGIFAIWLWKKIYGKECVSSPVFRLVLFFPWCLPSSTTFAVLVSMSGYFFEEYGLLIMLQNFACVILLTLENMIYFLIIGLD